MEGLEDKANVLLSIIVNRLPEEDAEGGVNEEEIKEAESSLGIIFPNSYRMFLHRVGFSTYPETIYGLGSYLLPCYNVVEVNKSERTDVFPLMPNHIVAFSPDGWGNHYCFDITQCEAEECPIVFWSHEQNEQQHLRKIYNNFVHWLEVTILEKEDNSG